MAHLIISISQPPYFSVEGFWQPLSSCLRSWATGTFCSSQHLHTDKVWRWASPQTRSFFFSFFLCHLPAWTLYVLLCLRRSSHLKWAIYKMLFTNPTRKSSIFFSKQIYGIPSGLASSYFCVPAFMRLSIFGIPVWINPSSTKRVCSLSLSLSLCLPPTHSPPLCPLSSCLQS